MGEVKTNAVRIAETNKLAHTLHNCGYKEAVDGVTVAGYLGVSPDIVFKTLVTQGKSNNYFVFVIPASAELDLKKAAASVGEKSVAMIPVKDINKVTGYVRGGCSPIGMKKQYVTRIHETAKALDHIFVSAGRIGQQLELNAVQLADLIHAEFTDLVQ